MAESPMSGMQAQQRDWSPFVAHFTKAAAMETLRRAVTSRLTPENVRDGLIAADEESFDTLQSILGDGAIRGSLPPATLPQRPRVCLSECTLPGLISHAERYGRCGLVFRKDAAFLRGGRPCLYVSEEVYRELGMRTREAEATEHTRRAFDLANIYRPPGFGRIQDYTHEREWRFQGDMELNALEPVALIVPTPTYVPRVPASVSSRVPVLPLTLLHRWGV